MKRKWFILLTIVVLTISLSILSGCGDSNESSDEGGEVVTSEEENSESTDEEVSDFDADAVIEDIKVKKIGPYTEEYSNATERGYAITAKNNSKYDIEISCEFTFIGKDDKPVGTAESSTSYVPAGGTTLLYAYDEMDKFSKVEWDLNVSEAESYIPTSDLKTESTLRSDQVIVSMTNKGKEDVTYASVNVAFMNGDKLVDCQTGYCTNDQDILKAGKTKTCSIEWINDEKVDSVIVYTDGYIEKEE